jgi:glycosyltransferase involved in cell wall biosynthesis
MTTWSGDGGGDAPLPIAFVILTIEGVQHVDGGVGRYLWNILAEAPALQQEWRRQGVELSFYAAETLCRPDAPTYSSRILDSVTRDLRAVGGDAVRLVSFSCGDNSYRDPLAGDERTHLVASAAAGQLVLDLGQRHAGVVVMSGNTLFAQVPVLLSRQADYLGVRIRCVHMTHSPVPPRRPGRPDARTVASEALAAVVRADPRVRIGYESEYMRRSYQKRFALPDAAMVNARSAILVDDPKFGPLAPRDIEQTLTRLGVPTDAELVLSWGRSDPSKGYDLLLKAAAHLSGAVVPVVCNPTENPGLRELDERLGTGAVFLVDQPFDVISAILQWHRTRVAAFLSVEEPASVAPAEAMLAARASGCVVVAVPTGCYPETVAHGVNGLIAADRTPDAVADAIAFVLALPEARRIELGREALRYVHERQNFSINFRAFVAQLLDQSWLDELREQSAHTPIRLA